MIALFKNPMLRLGLPVAVLVIALDQLSKWWVVEKLFRPDGVTETPFYSMARIDIAPVFDLVMTWNRGVSFGIFNQPGEWNGLALSGAAAVIVVMLIAWMSHAQSRMVALALGLVVGGAVGNVIDRLRFGAVADFLDVHLHAWHWPAFNLADSGITVGAIILVLDSLFTRRTSSKK